MGCCVEIFGFLELPGKTGPAEVAKGGSFGHTADSVKLQSTCSEFGVKLWGFRAVRDFFRQNSFTVPFSKRLDVGVIHGRPNYTTSVHK